MINRLGCPDLNNFILRKNTGLILLSMMAAIQGYLYFWCKLIGVIMKKVLKKVTRISAAAQLLVDNTKPVDADAVASMFVLKYKELLRSLLDSIHILCTNTRHVMGCQGFEIGKDVAGNKSLFDTQTRSQSSQ